MLTKTARRNRLSKTRPRRLPTADNNIGTDIPMDIRTRRIINRPDRSNIWTTRTFYPAGLIITLIIIRISNTRITKPIIIITRSNNNNNNSPRRSTE